MRASRLNICARRSDSARPFPDRRCATNGRQAHKPMERPSFLSPTAPGDQNVRARLAARKENVSPVSGRSRREKARQELAAVSRERPPARKERPSRAPRRAAPPAEDVAERIFAQKQEAARRAYPRPPGDARSAPVPARGPPRPREGLRERKRQPRRREAAAASGDALAAPAAAST